MDKLPTKILHAVFLQLDLEERIKCMFVCRKWWHVLDEYSLLYNVTIDGNSEKFTRFIAMIKAMPHRGAQVQESTSIGSFEHVCDKRELWILLPNVRVFKFEGYEDDMVLADQCISFNEPNTMVHSNSKIEVLADCKHCELALHLLTYELCGNLRELDLFFFRNSDTKSVIVSQLKNLPLLQKLCLKILEIGVKDLEMIHTHVPSIRDLQLKLERIKASEMPSDIVPVTALRNCFIGVYVINDPATHSQLYQYMTVKYTNVTNIDCVDPALTRSNSDDLEQIYQNGILDFLRMIGQKQNRLTICHMPDNLDIFAELDAVNAKIEELKIRNCFDKQLFNDLGRSKQSRFVRKLEIHNSEFDFEDSIMAMTSLHTVNISLSVDYGSATLNLADCLDAFPESVTKFSTSGYVLKADGFTTQQSQIEVLDISCILLDPSLAQIISSCFPKLKELTLLSYLEQNIAIDLDHPNLQSAKFITTNWYGYAFLFTCGNQMEYYVCHSGNKRRKIEARPVPWEEIIGYPIVLITTISDKKLIFSNEMIEIRS